MQRDNPQADQETNRQRAYGERAKERAKPLTDQSTPSVRDRMGKDEDRGFLRDEREAPNGDAPVMTPRDNRHPNLPDHADSDHGVKP